MADWTDGPEYAPAERPAAFAAPVAVPLDDAPPVRHLSSGAPFEPPSGFAQPRDPVPPLAALVPAPADQRDPRQAFQVTAAIMTAGSAWGSAHSAAAVSAPTWQPPGGAAWTADQPYASSYAPQSRPDGFPAPGTPQWFGPGGEWAPPAPRPAPTLQNAAKGASYGLLICLGIGGLIPMLAPFLLVLGWALASQVAYRRRAVQQAFIAAFLASLASAAIPIVSGGALDAVMETISLVALLCCWVLVFATLFLQYAALSAGETADR